MAEAVSLFPEPETPALRPVIAWSAVVLILLTILPWFTGGQDAVALLISGFALVMLAVLLWRQPSVRQVRGGVTVSLALALLGWGALSLIWSVNRYDTALWLIYLAMPILGFVLTAQATESLAIRRRLILGYLAVSLLFVGYGIWLYLTGGYARFTSVIYWPNPAAAYLLPALLITIDRATASGKKGWAYRIPAIILATGFWLADSRGATIALAVTLILYFAFTKEKIRYCINLVFIAIIGFTLSIACLQIREHGFHQSAAVTPGSRFAPASTEGNTSLSDRVNYLRSTFQIWETEPLWGTGAGTFPAVHPQHQIRVISNSVSAHNVYAQTFAELGLVGGLLLLLVAFSLVGVVVRSSWGRSELLAIGLGIVAILIHLGLDIDARYPAILMLLAVLGGLIYHPATVKRAPGRIIWVVAAVATLVPIVSLYQSQVWTDRAQIDEDNQQFDLAAQAYNQAHSGLTYNPTTLTGEGIDYYTLAKDGTNTKVNATLALDRAHEAEKLAPKDAQQYFLAARAEVVLGEYPAALADYQASTRLDPFNSPQYYLELAQVQFQLGQIKVAETTTTTAINLYPAAVLANRSLDTSLPGTIQQLYELRGLCKATLGDPVGANTDRLQAAAFGS